MNELSEKDWELVNAYHDGELGDKKRRILEERLSSEPLLKRALNDVAGMSASLRSLRPATQVMPNVHATSTMNRNWLPSKWVLGSVLAASIAFTIIFSSGNIGSPSALDIHTEFADQNFAVIADDIRTVVTTVDIETPDLLNANLTAVAIRSLKNGSAVHYAGHNGCRLTYFRNAFDVEDTVQSADGQVAKWSTNDGIHHIIVASGMDQAKFDAIASFLMLTTQQKSAEDLMAAVSNATTAATPCVG